MVKNVTVVTENQDYDSLNRQAIMDLIVDGLGESIVRGWVHHDNEGPKGGVSSRLYAVVEVNGIMVPAAINIYSDVMIENQVKKKIGEDKRSDRIRDALENAPKEIQATAAEEIQGTFTREELNVFNMDSLRMMLDRAGVDSDHIRYKEDLIELALKNL